MTTISFDTAPAGGQSTDSARTDLPATSIPWKYRPLLSRVRAHEKSLAFLEAGGIQSEMQSVRQLLRDAPPESAKKILAAELPRVFGAVCVIARRELALHPYDVQIIGAYELHRGRIAEMATGEGKTLVATMPAALLAMTGRSVHVVTVNDYLAQRDAQRMAPIYLQLGLTVGVILSHMPDAERRRAYACDVVYGTNKEFGFDYLRDQIKLARRRDNAAITILDLLNHTADDQPVMRGLHAAIVDEADSVLIDESRTPLVVAEAAGRSPVAWAYEWADKCAARLRDGRDFEFDPAKKTIEWTPEGLTRLSTHLTQTITPAAPTGLSWQTLTMSALHARHLYAANRHYVIANGEIVLIDEFTGRRMEGRTWAEGIHQAIQAKEKLPVTTPSKTLARTTYQHFFSLYEHLSGMTGTAFTSRAELRSVYNLKVAPIPTHRSIQRRTLPPVILRTPKEKWHAVAREIEHLRTLGRPILVGTASIEDSESLSRILHAKNIPHELLNARSENAQREADIIERAGQSAAVTIATNMAGRGTDIKLSPDARAAGGLHVIGTQLHESARIDRQLVGRSGRQGDPGSARFFLSLHDPILHHLLPKKSLLRLRAHHRGPWSTPITSRTLHSLFTRAQQKTEALHLRQRKHLMDYEEWISKIYDQMGK